MSTLLYWTFRIFLRPLFYITLVIRRIPICSFLLKFWVHVKGLEPF